jgi:hypothetical protein
MQTKVIAAGALSILGILIGLAAEAEAPRLDGHWEGWIDVRPAQFEVYMKLDLARAADGSLTGHLSYPDQETRQYGLDTVKVDDDDVLITSTDEHGTVSVFQGRSVEGGKVLRGVLTEGGRIAPFELRRTLALPAIPPEVQTLAPDGAELKALFNRDQEKVRLLLIFSPTCSTCRAGARLVERHLLERLRDPHLDVYVVWEKLGPHDSAAAAAQAAALLSDPRIHHFWSPDHFASTALRGPVGLERTPAWDVFLLFGKGKRWDAAPPSPDSFMHDQKQNPELPKDRLLNADTLATEAKTLLGAPAPPARGR